MFFRSNPKLVTLILTLILTLTLTLTLKLTLILTLALTLTLNRCSDATKVFFHYLAAFVLRSSSTEGLS